MAGKIPQHFVDDLISRSDIVEVINGRVQLKKAGREYKACCPFHNENTPSFTVSPTKQFYYCFGCGAHGTALGFLMEHDHMSFVEAVEELASIVGVEVPRVEGGAPVNRNKDLFTLMDSVCQHYVVQLKNTPSAVNYLKSRGLSGSVAKTFGLGYAPDDWDGLKNTFGRGPDVVTQLKRAGLVIERDGASGVYDRFRGRIMFPIRDVRGRIIGFGGRILDQGEPKYLNSPETPLFHKGRELYGLFEARQALRDIPFLMVVEGYMDVVGLYQHGIRNAVATLGTATTEEHLRRLFRITQEVVFCFDGDRAGRAAAWRALENALPETREGRQIKFLFLPDGHDPDSLIRQEGQTAFEKRLKESLPLSDYMANELASRVELGSVEGKAQFADLARPLLNRLPEGVYKTLLIQRMANTVRLDTGKLSQLIGIDRQRTQRPEKRRPATSKRSLVHQAIGLLLSHPMVAESSRAVDLETLRQGSAGHGVLYALIQDVLEAPSLTTAGLLEKWRERTEGPYLRKLVQIRLDQVGYGGALTQEGLKTEFLDMLGRLLDGLSPDREKVLLAKMSEQGLNEEEMEELKALHRARNSDSGDTAN